MRERAALADDRARARRRAGPARRSSTALPIEGTFRSHQVPISDPATHPGHLAAARSLAEELPARGAVRRRGPPDARARRARAAPASAAWARTRTPTAACCCATCACRDFRDYACAVPVPGAAGIGDTHVLGPFLRDVVRLNEAQRNFRVFGPDETLSNGLEAVFEATERQWNAETIAGDEYLAPSGRVMEMLSEHQCQGWLEGYLLTGRHGLFNCYEAFIHIVDSMFNQHAKWLKVTARIPVAAPDRLAQLPARLARLAPGPQRLHPPGPRLHRPRRQQEGGDRARVPAARRELPALGDGPLPAQPALRQRRRRRQAPRAAMAGRWTRRPPIAQQGIGIWDWASSDPAAGARPRHGLLRRRADARDAGRGRDPARTARAS